jgi:hypothetical protein
MLFYASKAPVHVFNTKDDIVDLNSVDSPITTVMSSAEVNFEEEIKNVQGYFSALKMKYSECFLLFLQNQYDTIFNVMEHLKPVILQCLDSVKVPNTELNVYDLKRLQPGMFLNGQVYIQICCMYLINI